MARDARPLNGGRSFNLKTRRWRKPWRDLDEKGRKRRYQQAVVAHANGLPSPPGTFAEFAKRQRALDRHQHVEKPSYRGRAMPPFFGSSARTQILAILAANGPMTVRDLARLRRKDSAATFRAVERLIRCGLVAKRLRPGGRKYVGINRAHAALPDLLALLRKLVDHYGCPSVSQARFRWGLPTISDPAPPSRSPPCSDRPCDRGCSSFSRSLGRRTKCRCPGSSVIPTPRSGTHRPRSKRRRSSDPTPSGSRRVFSLATHHAGAHEYRRFLIALAEKCPVYRSLAAAITANYETVAVTAKDRCSGRGSAMPMPSRSGAPAGSARETAIRHSSWASTCTPRCWQKSRPANQPGLAALPETAKTGPENVWRVVTRLAREGLVRRYERPAPGAPHELEPSSVDRPALPIRARAIRPTPRDRERE